MKKCNLLPWKIQRQQLLVGRLRQWAVVTVASLMLTMVWFSLAWQRRAAEQRDADELNRQSRFVTYLSNQVDSLRKQNRALAYREALFTKLEHHVFPLSVLGIVGESAAACRGVVVERVESAERAERANKPAADAALVSIHVEAASSLPVAQFVLALRERQAFRKVELKSDGNHLAGGQTSNSYTIECTF